MAENTGIEWCDHTFNPWEGCQKVGPGCDNCYAETRNARYNKGEAVNWGPGAPRRRTSESNWRKPLKWNREAEAFYAKHGRRQRVFCASLADVFDNAVDPQWRADLFALIDQTLNLDWLLLTKRIGNVQTMLHYENRAALPRNVWLGITVVNQEEADRDIPKLLAIDASVRFLSMEPLLGPVDLTKDLRSQAEVISDGRIAASTGIRAKRRTLLDGIDWVIVGGESGPGARPMHPDWARSLRDQCVAAGVPFLFKQWGESGPLRPELIPVAPHNIGWVARDGRHKFGCTEKDHEPMYEDDDRFGANYWSQVVRVGKKAAGRLLDGVEHNSTPHGEHRRWQTMAVTNRGRWTV